MRTTIDYFAEHWNKHATDAVS